MKSSRLRLMALVIALVLVSLGVFTACTPEPAITPGVSIGSPLDGAQLQAGDITVSISVSDFSIVNKLGESIAAGEGHVHYYLDAEPPTTPPNPLPRGIQGVRSSAKSDET